MLVAKLPGSTYATAATNAGPRNGTRARRPRVCPLRALSAARSTRSSPGSATATGSGGVLTGGGGTGAGETGESAGGIGASTATLAGYLHENGSGQAERDVRAAAFDANADRALELAFRHDLDPGSRQEAAALELAEASGVVIRHALHDNLLA